MGVLPIPQSRNLGEAQRELVGKRVAVSQVPGDGRVVESDVLERLEGQAPPLLQGKLLLAGQPLPHPFVVGGVYDDSHVRKVLRRGAYQGRPADVDILEGVAQGHVRVADGLHEGVEISDHHVDGIDAVLGQLRRIAL